MNAAPDSVKDVAPARLPTRREHEPLRGDEPIQEQEVAAAYTNGWNACHDQFMAALRSQAESHGQAAEHDAEVIRAIEQIARDKARGFWPRALAVSALRLIRQAPPEPAPVLPDARELPPDWDAKQEIAYRWGWRAAIAAAARPFVKARALTLPEMKERVTAKQAGQSEQAKGSGGQA